MYVYANRVLHPACRVCAASPAPTMPPADVCGSSLVLAVCGGYDGSVFCVGYAWGRVSRVWRTGGSVARGVR